MPSERELRIAWKTLSSNDVGATGSHQAGVHVPKELVKEGMFDALGTDSKNPRKSLVVALADGEVVSVQFIYYNNRFFGGTRDEYRLTRLSSVLRRIGANAGDVLRIERQDRSGYRILLDCAPPQQDEAPTLGPSRLRLSGGWVMHSFRRRI